MTMNEYIKKVLKDNQLKVSTVAKGIGINAQTYRAQINGIHPMTLTNLIMTAEFIAKQKNRYTHDCLSEFLQYDSDFKNAIRRDLIRMKK